MAHKAMNAATREIFDRHLQSLRANTLTHLTFDDSCWPSDFQLNSDELAELVSAIEGNSSLCSISLCGKLGSNDVLQKLLPVLKPQPKLRIFSVRNAPQPINNQTLSLLADTFCGHPSIEVIAVEKSGMATESAQTTDKFVELVTKTPRLSSLILEIYHVQRPFTALADAAKKKNTKTLVNLSPLHGAYIPLLDANWVSAATLLITLRSYSPEELPIHLLCKAATRLPAIRWIARSEEDEILINELDKLLEDTLNVPHENLVKLTAKELCTRLAPTGLTYLDTPTFWENFTDIAQQHIWQGEEITKALLMQTNKDGAPSIISGFSCGQTDAILAHLNAHGEYFTPDDLLDGKEPNTLLNVLIEEDAIRKLFTLDNWRGQGASAMLRVYRALPDPVKEQIPGIQALTARLSRAPAPTDHML